MPIALILSLLQNKAQAQDARNQQLTNNQPINVQNTLQTPTIGQVFGNY